MIGWVFPGQGSQSVGMDRAADHPVTYERATACLGWDVRAACNDPDALGRTEVSQPAIFTVSIASALGLRAEGEAPDAVAGHSVGEFAALVVAGAIAFEDALGAIDRRARAMARAGHDRAGGMVAVIGLSAQDAAACCQEAAGAVAVASINAPDQVVLSGDRDALGRAADLARAAGARRVIALNVSVAAHSPLMAPATDELRSALAGITIAVPSVPFVSSVTGRVESEPESIARSLCDGLTAPVRWVDAVRRLQELGVSTFRELQPGNVLSGLIRRLVPAETSS